MVEFYSHLRCLDWKGARINYSWVAVEYTHFTWVVDCRDKPKLGMNPLWEKTDGVYKDNWNFWREKWFWNGVFFPLSEMTFPRTFYNYFKPTKRMLNSSLHLFSLVARGCITSVTPRFLFLLFSWWHQMPLDPCDSWTNKDGEKGPNYDFQRKYGILLNLGWSLCDSSPRPSLA